MRKTTKAFPKTPAAATRAARLEETAPDAGTPPPGCPAAPVILELDAPRNAAGPSLPGRISEILRGSLTLLRGRVTRRTAWFLVEVRDGRDRLAELLRRISSCGIRVRPAPAGNGRPSPCER